MITIEFLLNQLPYFINLLRQQKKSTFCTLLFYESFPYEKRLDMATSQALQTAVIILPTRLQSPAKL